MSGCCNPYLVVKLAIGVLLAASIAAGGYLAGRGVLLSRLQERYVTVKGVAELELKANLAVMPLRFTVTASDPRQGQEQLERLAGTVVAFLKERGFADGEIALGGLEVQDTVAQGMREEARVGGARYVLAQTATVRTGEVDRVTQLSRALGELVRRGVVLGDQSGGPSYIVTADRLNQVKPDLIRRATEAARTAAEEFAQMSGGAVGTIRRANQGVIVILPRDESPDTYEPRVVDKRIRAVATVDYYLLAR